MNPKISVILPTYNREKLIFQALGSMDEQSFKDYELIVVDDGSEDNTEKVVKRFQKRIDIKYFKIPHGGEVVALNHGFARSRGIYETYITSDNVFFSNFLGQLTGILDNDSSIDFCYADFLEFNENTHILGEIIRPKTIKPPFVMEHLTHGYVMGICFLFKKEIREKVGPFKQSHCPDYRMVVDMAKQGAKFYHHESILGINRKHKEQGSKIHKRKIDKEVLEIRREVVACL